jgi:hypothetical protein
MEILEQTAPAALICGWLVGLEGITTELDEVGTPELQLLAVNQLVLVAPVQ